MKKKLKSDSPLRAATCSPSSAHDVAWETHFIKPMIRIMQEKGIREIHITIKDGKAAYVIDPVAVECKHDAGHEMNGVGMWICLGCRADITPENAEVNPAPDKKL